MVKKGIVIGTGLIIGQGIMMTASASVMQSTCSVNVVNGAEFLSTQMEQKKADYQFSFESSKDETDPASVLDALSEWTQENGYSPADYFLTQENQTIAFWLSEDQTQVLSCSVQNLETKISVEMKLQHKEHDETSQDFSKLPFDLSYGATSDEIETALEGYAWHYDVIEEEGSANRGCYTVFMPGSDDSQYIQLYSMSLDSVQFLEPYAASGFSFSQKDLLAKAVYHLNTEYDTERCINEVKPELEEALGTLDSQSASWVCEHDTKEVLKDSTLLTSKLWADMESMYRVYDSVTLSQDEETDHFDVTYDGSRGLILQTVAEWELVPAE